MKIDMFDDKWRLKKRERTKKKDYLSQHYFSIYIYISFPSIDHTVFLYYNDERRNTEFVMIGEKNVFDYYYLHQRKSDFEQLELSLVEINFNITVIK